MSFFDGLPWWSWLLTGGVSLLLFLSSLVAVPFVVTRIPADYFVRTSSRDGPTDFRSTVWLVLRNLLGVVLFLVGVIMLVAPGPGLITILLSLILMTIPGKKELLLKLLRRKGVHDWINERRAKAGRPPLQLPPLPNKT